MAKVINVENGTELFFTLPPEQAVVAAHAQSRKDGNTWGYKEKYQAKKGKFGWICGNYWTKL